MATDKDIFIVLTELAARYPGFTLTRATILAYTADLRDIEADLLQAATDQVKTTCKFYPSIAEIRAAISDIVRMKAGIPSMFEAWTEIINYPRDGRIMVREPYWENGVMVCEYVQASWTHGIVKQVADQLGWPDFPDHNNLMADRAHFYKAYSYALETAMRDIARLPSVTAYIESGRSGDTKLLSSVLEDYKNGR